MKEIDLLTILDYKGKLYLKNNEIPHDWVELKGNYSCGNLKLEYGHVIVRNHQGYKKEDLLPNHVPIFYTDSRIKSSQIQIHKKYLSYTPWDINESNEVKSDNNLINNNLKSSKDGDNTIKVRRPDIQIGRSEKVRGSSLSSRRS